MHCYPLLLSYVIYFLPFCYLSIWSNSTHTGSVHKTWCFFRQPLKLIWRYNFSGLLHHCECAKILPRWKDQASTTEGPSFLLTTHAIWTWHSLPLTGVCVSWVSQPTVEQQKITSPTITGLLRSHRKHVKLKTPLIHRKNEWLIHDESLKWWLEKTSGGRLV